MNPVRLIETKRDGGTHSRVEIQWIVDSCLRLGEEKPPMSAEQLGAWLMAVVLRGMTAQETGALTLAMAGSGERVDLTGLPKPWVDKHSTGGVGDKTTLVLLPMLAACGLTVVKMSGRGLGKTGGTIDKLESIPGFRTALSIPELKNQAGEIGLALTGQTPKLAPADGVLYAMRDVTGTVRSIPLIASSVLSKKIAGGAEAVSIDLKCGSGAFMETLEEARALAGAMMGIAAEVGLKLGIEITDMDQPLGHCVGNALEVQEAMDVLLGKSTGRFCELCVELCASTLELVGVPEAHGKSEAVLHDGSALAKAREWLSAQGSTLHPDEMHQLPLAPISQEIVARRSGCVARVDARAIGEAVVDLGGGRRHKGVLIDHSVGIEVLVEVGNEVRAGQPLLLVRGSTPVDLEFAVEVLDGEVPHRPVILERLGGV